MRKLALLSSLVVAAALIASVSASRADDKKASHKAAVGQPAPAFSATDQNGKPVNLSDFAGKVVVLEWFNDGCPYVQKFYDTGKMNQFARSAREKGVVWLAVNTTKGRTAADNKSVADKWNIDRPILTDSDGAKIARAYGAKTTPHMFVIAPDGTLAYSGAIDNRPDPDPKSLEGADNYVNAAIDLLLAGKELSTRETKPYGCGVKY